MDSEGCEVHKGTLEYINVVRVFTTDPSYHLSVEPESADADRCWDVDALEEVAGMAVPDAVVDAVAVVAAVAAAAEGGVPLRS